ncbi:SAM-dependent methyltransferase [Sinorhizobium fredii]|uniref:Methyltransferase domain-containing protein n=1 Tax=Sinorhizobium fredii (strain USDA 257) TaxID=1185652 RepID=I3XCE2_SINF2|nr:class I SAM-dependent methyltransferase [Sinorhizobium fredii]AFL53548.1 hypothetical protein USDA257_c50210 [Sinorhizobium fredii USDA 257]
MADDRIGWAVEMLAPKPAERILEIGCGHGVAATMVCDRLIDGRMLAIDRSAAMIEAARRRNAAFVAAGRAEFQVAELARADFGNAVFDKVFALRVGIFARGNPERELSVLRRHLAPQGRLFLFHDEPTRGARDLVGCLEAGLSRNGWTVQAWMTHEAKGCDIACVVAEAPGLAI